MHSCRITVCLIIVGTMHAENIVSIRNAKNWFGKFKWKSKGSKHIQRSINLLDARKNLVESEPHLTKLLNGTIFLYSKQIGKT